MVIVSRNLYNKHQPNSKAFTLIELMGVIMLLGIIALITLIVVNNNIKRSEDVLYNTQINNIKDGARNWGADNIKSLPNDGEVYLTLAQLKQGGYVDENIKSPANNKMCFPNDLVVQIVAKDSGSYEYNVNTDNITYIDCEDDLLDRNSPYIVLAKGDAINKNNEVVDYVEVDQTGTYTVPVSYAYDQNGNLITSDANFSATISYISGSNDTYISLETITTTEGTLSIVIDDIKDYTKSYKIEYVLEYNGKSVKAIRNIILQDTKAPEITFDKTEDIVLYYSDTSVQTINYIFSQVNVSDNSSAVNCLQDSEGTCYYKLEGADKINAYFKSDEFKAISPSDYANFSKEFPVIVTATDAVGNTSKKTQNITITLKEVKEPILKLVNGSDNVIYASDGTVTYEDKWYDNNKFKIKVESGCPIDYNNSYYTYNGNKTSFNTLNLNNRYDFSVDVALEDGSKNLEIYTTCEGNVDRNIFKNIEAVMPRTAIKIDLNDPVCEIIVSEDTYNSTAGWYTSKPTITYKLNDSNTVTGTFTNNTIKTNLTGNTDSLPFIANEGINTYTLEGKDAAGKTCTATKIVKVDTTASSVAKTSSYPLTTYKSAKYVYVYYNAITQTSSSGSGSTYRIHEISPLCGGATTAATAKDVVTSALDFHYSTSKETIYYGNYGNCTGCLTDGKVTGSYAYAYGTQAPTRGGVIKLTLKNTYSDCKSVVVYPQTTDPTFKYGFEADFSTTNYTSTSVSSVLNTAATQRNLPYYIHTGKVSSATGTTKDDFLCTSVSSSGVCYSSKTRVYNSSHTNEPIKNTSVYNHSIDVTDSGSGIQSISGSDGSFKTYSCTPSETFAVSSSLEKSITFTVTDCVGNIQTFTSS